MQMDKVKALIDLRDGLRDLRSRQREIYENCLMEFGDFTYGTPTCFTWGEDAKVKIGKFCSIGANVQIYLGGNHHNDWCTTYPFNAMPQLRGCWDDIDEGHAFTKGDVIIGNDVWIASDVKIMSGVTIGDGATIANGAIVIKDVMPYTLVGGIPAKTLKRKMTPAAVSKLKWWDWPMEKIAEAVPLLCGDDATALIEFDRRWNDEH